MAWVVDVVKATAAPSAARWRTVPLGDSAVLVEFAEPQERATFSKKRHRLVRALDLALASGAGPVGIIEVQPALVNLAIHFDPLVCDQLAVAAWVERTASVVSDSLVRPRLQRIEVSYDRSVATDLDSVSEELSMLAGEVIDAHQRGDYEVLMYGFAPGYAYLGGLPQRLGIPRKPSVVRDVPAGSVIIAGGQCLVTTIAMPTGWWVIGHSETPLLSDDPDAPFVLAVGDRVEFVPVERDPGARS